MRGLRFALGFLTLLVAVALVGGTYLAVKISETTRENRDFICLFSGALTKEPINQQAAETDSEFLKRVEQTTLFVDELNKLDGCGFDPPIRVVVDERDQGILKRDEGGGQSSAAPPSSQPGPPSGGPPPNPGGGNSTDPSPEQPLDPACELSQDLNVPLC